MSMMECAHCQRTADARSMTSCDGCGGMICEECGKSDEHCMGEDIDYEA